MDADHQTEFDFTPLARTTDPWTSHTAAATVDVANSQRIVLEAFRQHGQMDDRTLVQAVCHAMSDSRARGARCELARAGYLEVVGTTGKPPRRVWRMKQQQVNT